MLRITWDTGVFLVLALATYTALDFARAASYLPLYVGTAGTILAGLLTARDVRAFILTKKVRSSGGELTERSPANVEVPPTHSSDGSSILFKHLLHIAPLMSYVALVWLIGFPVASVLFIVAYLLFIAHARLLPVVVSVGVLGIVLWLMGSLLNMRWPTGVIQTWLR